MCGVVGLFRRSGTDVVEGTLSRMTARVAHRGPDGQGVVFLDPARGAEPVPESSAWTVGLGHRRLSIIDLSEAGAQPMRRGELWISYNGEVFNYVEIRAELEARGHVFRSDSDTEVILAAWQQWGEAAFERLRGMWGLILVDRARRTAVLSRDRLGIKPLYWTRRGGLLAVVSEPKQALELPGRLVADDRAVLDYLATGWESAERSFFEGVQPVPAGTTIAVDLDTLELAEPESYWRPERVRPVLSQPWEAADELRRRLDDSVSIHLRSDVPVGCALSGGLDSSALAVTVDALSPPEASLHVFSATFAGHPMDEAPFVDVVARAIRAERHSTSPDVEDVRRDLDDFVYAHDEPVGSLSQYAAYAVARLTRGAGVPVTLNGQGGDEILSGYWQTYFAHLQGLGRRDPLALAVHAAGAAAPGGNRELFRQVPGMARRLLSRLRPGRVLPVRDLGLGVADGAARVTEVLGLDPQARRVYEVRRLTLPRLLKWDDRNFMAFSVEGRYPLLDHPLIELCLAFAPEVLYERGWSKMPLRRALADRLPREIAWRRTKWGFETPQDRWLLGGLRAPIDGMLLDPEAPVWRYVRAEDGQALARRVRADGARDREAMQALFRLWNVDRWLRVFAL